MKYILQKRKNVTSWHEKKESAFIRERSDRHLKEKKMHQNYPIVTLCPPCTVLDIGRQHRPHPPLRLKVETGRGEERLGGGWRGDGMTMVGRNIKEEGTGLYGGEKGGVSVEEVLRWSVKDGCDVGWGVDSSNVMDVITLVLDGVLVMGWVVV